MTAHKRLSLSSDEVLNRIRAEIETPTSTTTGSGVAARIARIQSLQRDFRVEPLGGRLPSIKKVFHWFVASAFDRQAKVIESLLAVVDDLSNEVQHVNRLVAHLERRPNVNDRSGTGSNSHTISPDSIRIETSDPALAESMKAILGLSAEMMEPERVLLYSLVYALKPSYCLEIGTFRGGSSSIICRAMDDNGHGQLVCVDPEPRIPDEVWAAIRHRAALIQGPSPSALADARRAVPRDFDLILIDGDHSYEGALGDIEGVLEFLSNGAYVVLHDCHFFEVKKAIEEALDRHPGVLVDCGVVSVTENPQHDEGGFVDGKQIVWGGLYLLRYTRAATN